MEFNERIKFLQKALNMSQEEFARNADISFRLIGNWYYRGSSPSAEILEKIVVNIPAINPSWLLREEGPPLLMKNVWSASDEFNFRNKDYKEMTLLFEKAPSTDLIPEFYRVLGAANWVQQLDIDLGRLFAGPLKMGAWLFRKIGIPFITEFYAQILWRMIIKVSANSPLTAAEAYALCYIGEIELSELRGLVSVDAPHRISNLDDLHQLLPARMKMSYRFYNMAELSGSPGSVIQIGIKRAFEQMARVLQREEFPGVCLIHNKLFWQRCPMCHENLVQPRDNKHDGSKEVPADAVEEVDASSAIKSPEDDTRELIEFLIQEISNLQAPKKRDVDSLVKCVCKLSKKSKISKNSLMKTIEKEWKR